MFVIVAAVFAVNTVLWVLLVRAQLKRRTFHRHLADHAPAATMASLVIAGLAIWFLVHHRYRSAAVVGLVDVLAIAQAIGGWWLRHKVEDKWQPWY